MEPLTIALLAGGAGSVGTLAALGLKRLWQPKQPDTVAPAVSTANQAITEAELIATAVDLKLPAEIVELLRHNVRTVGQLESMVASVRAAALRSIEEKMLNLALSHARRQSAHNHELLAKVLVIAQANAPHGAVHTAFAAIASDIVVAGPAIIEWAKRQQDEWNKGIQRGSWVKSDLVEQGREENRLLHLGRYRDRDSQPYSWDVLVPLEQGAIGLERITAYDDIGRITSRYAPANYDVRDDKQAAFWSAFAQQRLDELSGREPRSSGFAVHGSLIDWTRFLSAVRPRPALA